MASASARVEESLQDVEMQEVTNSTQSHLFLSSGASRGVRTSQGGQAMFAWKQQSESLFADIRTIVASIRKKHEDLGRKFKSLGYRTLARENFKAHEELFNVTVEDGRLFHRIEETLAKEQRSIEEAAHYYESVPVRAPKDVEEVQNRLIDILENLENIERYFEDVEPVPDFSRRSRSEKQVSDSTYFARVDVRLYV